jgi:hypothetical protein
MAGDATPTTPGETASTPAEIFRQTGATLLVVPGRPESTDDCQGQTVLQTSLPPAQTVVGQKLCVRTSDGR